MSSAITIDLPAPVGNTISGFPRPSLMNCHAAVFASD
jgi:hypothetical protein